MKCPVCSIDLVPSKQNGLDVEYCPSCNGTWLSREELDELEDEAFDFGDDEKGSLMLGSTSTTRKCPQCDKLMKSFQYRLYDLQMDFCEDGHGYWLDAGEDKRVLELMRKEESDLERKVLAEDKWSSYVKGVRSDSFLDKVRNLFR